MIYHGLPYVDKLRGLLADYMYAQKPFCITVKEELEHSEDISGYLPASNFGEERGAALVRDAGLGEFFFVLANHRYLRDGIDTKGHLAG